MREPDYEKAERGHGASMQPVVENLGEEFRREHRERKGGPGQDQQCLLHIGHELVAGQAFGKSSAVGRGAASGVGKSLNKTKGGVTKAAAGFNH